MKKNFPFLFVVTCVVCVSCAPPATNDADAPPSTNSDTKQLQVETTTMKQEQDDKLTINEKQRALLLKQDYQGALDQMSQFEKEIFDEIHAELFEEALQNKEFRENEKSKEDARCAVLYIIRSTYCYLYQALGKDEEALQKFKEIEFPKTTNPELLYLDSWEKVFLLGRLKRVDEMINEMNSFFNNPNISEQSLSSLQHAVMMSTLINAQLVKGDIESAQKNIRQLRDNLRRWPIRIIAVQQEHAKFSEMLSLLEYYVSNLTRTHTMRIMKAEVKPPSPSPDDPKRVSFECSGIGFECVSKTDGTPFTIEDFRKIQAEQLRRQDPFLQPPPAPQHLEVPFSLPSPTPQ